MEDTKKTFYVTTPIYYVTAKPHLGSLYSTVLADVAARWNKLQGKPTFLLTGTDEHGQKVAQAAAKVGKEPKEFVDSFIDSYKTVWKNYEIDYNYFIRTTDQDHIAAVQDWLLALQKKGDIYKALYQGWYCTHCETFVTEKEALGHDANAPLCPSCARATTEVSEETYFFRLSAYQDRLLEFYERNPDFIIPKERAHEVVNFVKAGLKDLSITRTTVRWGIPFPGDNKHVTYVWADALNNYITAIGYDNPARQEEFKRWWPANVHVMGKDIVRFHAIYWPAFLMASDLPLPKHLLVHGWINVNQQKMSKSFGNVVDPQDLYAKYGPEPVRYYLIRQLAITHDSEFSIEDLEQKIGSDLADALGNLLNRMVSLASKHEVVEIPQQMVWSEKAVALRNECLSMLEEFKQYMSEYSYHMAYARLWRFINSVNAFFHAQEPWKLGQKQQEQFLQIISATCHSLRAIAFLAWPVMPRKMEQLLDSLGVSFGLQADTIENLELGNWNQQFVLKKIPNLFQKPEIVVETSPAEKPEQTKPAGEHITIDDLTKVQLIVGTIQECEIVPQSEKLYRMQVDLGNLGMRQILAGIRQSYTAQDLIGKQGIFVANLQPRKLLGLESQGMMLVAEGADGKVKMATVAQAVPNGMRLR